MLDSLGPLKLEEDKVPVRNENCFAQNLLRKTVLLQNGPELEVIVEHMCLSMMIMMM